MSLGRILAGFVVGGVQVFARAFQQAYREAAAGGGKQAAGAANAAKNAAGRSVRTGMSIDEAQKILNIESTATLEEINQKYDQLFQLNDKKKGGSFYLQSKIYRARETLEQEWPEKFAEAKTSDAKSSESASSETPKASDKDESKA